MKRLSSIIIFLIILISSVNLKAQTKVLQIDLKEEIDPGAWRTVKNAFEMAKENQSDLILIHLNTYGGMLDYADSIRTKILNSTIPTIVFIDNNAASAGALISIACDKIYMQKGATIGAASVVNGNGEVLPEKYQSYMRGLMRTTAETKGRDPKIAEAFVDPDVFIENLSQKGKVLTLTTKEAIAIGYCVAEANTIDEVLTQEGVKPYEINVFKPSLTDKIIAILTSPAVSSILILLLIGGIYFELQSPGIGFALLVAIVAGALFFAPLYLEGLANNWEILLFVVGVFLLVLEIFVIPGFGIFGILGIIFMVTGLAFSMILNDFFDLSMSGSQNITSSFLLVLGSIIGAIIVSVFFGGSLLKSKAFQRLVLKDEQLAKEGYQVAKPDIEILGKFGFAKTDLRPSGKIEVDGNWYQAVSNDGFIENGTDIVVTKIENHNLVVRRK